MSKPRYVDLDGGSVFRPPFLQKDTFLSAWLLGSDRGAQQRLLDRAFNEPSGGAVDYRALTSHVLLSFANIAQISSLDPRDRGYGYTQEVDTVFWILAGAYQGGELDRLVFYCPYIWVNSALALVAGREVYGFPKAIGWANVPTSPHDAGPFWTEGLVIPHRSPTTPVSRERIFTLTRDPEAAPSALSFEGHQGVLAAAALLIKLFEAGVEAPRELLATLLADLVSIKVPVLFLKQLRDFATDDRASYQAILEANASVTELRGAGLLSVGWDFALQQYDSLRVADTLGLAPRQSIDLGFWVDFSFSMDLGREIWRAP
jgi:hypothetical protein